MTGTEKCAYNIKSKICAELCHQGIGLLYSTCFNQYIGMWFKYAGESTDNSTIIVHRKAGNKRWKLTILTAKPKDVEEVCEQVYLKESKTFWESNACCARCVTGGGSGGPIPYRIYVDIELWQYLL